MRVTAGGARAFVLELALPFMQEVGHRWSRQDLVVMHEHFASELLRGFLAQQLRGLSNLAGGPRVICAALPGERHSLGLQMAAVGLLLGTLLTVPVAILLQNLFQGVSSLQWSSLLVFGSVLLGTVVLASASSASGAAKVDPVRTLAGD